MQWWDETRRRLAALWHRDVLDRDLEEEMQSHLEMQAGENRESGMDAAAARYAALRQFGNAALLKETSRQAWGWGWLEDLGQDLRYAARALRQSAGFSVAAIVTLALGIGANTAVFSALNALLLRDLPVDDPSRLVRFLPDRSFSHPDFLDYRDQSSSFDGISAVYPDVAADFSGGGAAVREFGEVVSANYFSVAGVRPVLGRRFTPSEDRIPGAVVVVSNALWRRRFGGQPGVLGKTVGINSHVCTIVGVAPEGFRGTRRGYVADFWVPLSVADRIMPWAAEAKLLATRDERGFMLLGRLHRGIGRKQAAAEAAVIGDRIRRLTGMGPRDGVTLADAGALAGTRARQIGNWTTALMVVAAILLLIACANVSGLQLARAVSRRREVGIRLAIGASRGRIVRQLLTESLLLSGVGAAIGFALALAATHPISRLELPSQERFAVDVSPDARALMFTAALSVLAAVAFGLAPALRATRQDPAWGLRRDAGRSAASGSSLRSLLVAAQVALSVALVVDAGLVLHSLWKLLSIDPGFRSDGVVVFNIDPRARGYSQDASVRLFRSIQERLTALPGISSASIASIAPLSNFTSGRGFWAEGQHDDKTRQLNVVVVSADYFETLGIPLLRGQGFDRNRGEPQAIVNQTAARLLFAGENPIGRRILSYDRKRAYEVIAVTPDTKLATLAEEPGPCMYQMFDQAPGYAVFGMAILARTAINPRAMIEPVRAEIAAIDPDLAVHDLETMQAHIGKGLAGSRFAALLFGTFGAIGLAIAAVGLYGLMSFAARCRAKEIAIRAALGASSAQLLRMLAARGMGLALCGAAAGLLAASAAARLVSSFLYGITVSDAPVFIAAPAVLLLACLAATVIPARRAAKTDPMEALRHD